MLVVRVEMTAGCLEVRGIAEGFLVDVDGVFADGEVFQVEFDGELTALDLLEGGGSGVLASAGFDGNDDGIVRLSEGGDGQEAQTKGG